MRFGVLGTLTVLDDQGGQVRLGGPARRRLLAALLARAPRTVAVDTLLDDLWGDSPPATAEKTLQSHVVRLRDDLGRQDGMSPLVTEPLGYRLDVPGHVVDAWCFERDLDAGRRALAAGDAVAARPLLDQALSWWRGDAYAELPDVAFAVSERLRLGELRALGAEARTDAALALGGAGELVPELEARVRHEPYREHTWEQLVVALYRSGRQGDALAAYRRARDRLVDDLGLEPSPALRSLENRVLDQDPALLAPVVAAHAGGGAADVAHPVVVGATAPDLLPAPAPDDAVDGGSGGLSVAALVVGECPYRGLRAYDAEDAEVFVGRERLTAELAGRLVDNDLLVVAGPSGAGKSSLLRAGLVPALRRGAIPGSAAWRVRVVSPGTNPLAALDGQGADVLVVDQAEELFTVAADTDLAAVGRRLAALLSSGTRVVLALRADFFGRLADLEVLTGRIGSSTVLVGALTEEEVRRVVTEPAAAAGVSTAPALVAEVVSDVRGQAGFLPLLSAALERTWRARTGDRLTLEAYRAGGGVRGALESMAEEAYAGLDEPAQQAARRLLLRLTTRSGGVWVRRPLPLAAAAPMDDPAAADALARLATARLVTVGATSVELAHEALIGGWPRLRAWLDERALVADQLEHLADATVAWQGAGRRPEDLLRGTRLAAAQEWQDEHPDDLSALEREFVAASGVAVGAELATERRRRRRLTMLAAGVAVAALVATSVGVVAVRERGQAQQSALAADARRLAAQSYTTADPPTSLLLAAAGYRLQDSTDTRGALLSAVQREGGALFRIPTESRLLWVGAPADGSRVLAVDNTRTVLVFDPGTRRLVTSYAIPGDAVSDVSPDGTQLVACGQAVGETTTGLGRVVVLDARTGVVRAVLPTLGSEAANRCALFTRDGRHLVVAAYPHGVPTGPAGTSTPGSAVAVYDVGDWSRPAWVRPFPAPVMAFATSRDGVVVEHADGTTEVLSAVDGRPLGNGRLRVGASCDDQTTYCGVAISPAGDQLAFVDPAHAQTPEVVPAADVSGQPRSGQGLGAPIDALAFSPDGGRLAAAGADGSVLVLTAPGLATVVTDTAGGTVQGLAWAGTGTATALYSVGLDSALSSWDLASLPRTVALGGAVPPDDGDEALFGSEIVGTRTGPDGVQLYATDIRTGRSAAVPVAVPAGWQPESLMATPDGSRAVFSLSQGDGGARVLVWDTRSGAVLLDTTVPAPSSSPPREPLTAAPSADGRQVFVATGQHSVEVVDVASHRVVRTLSVHFLGAASSRAWPMPWAMDPHGRLVLLGVEPGRTGPVPAPTPGATTTPGQPRSQQVAVVDPVSGRTLGEAAVGTLPVDAMAWSPDGSRLAVGTSGGTIGVYDAATMRPVTDRVQAHHGYVLAMSYSPDGRTLLTSGTDGAVSFWDATTLSRVGAPTVLGRVGWVWAWYAPDGTVAGTAPSGPTDPTPDRWFRMPGTPSAWLSDACRFAGHDLSRTDWARYVGDQPYRSVCPRT